MSNIVDYWRITAPAKATLLDVLVQGEPQLDLWIRVADDNHRIIGFANLSQPGAHEVLRNLPVTPFTRYTITTHGLHGTRGAYNLTADFYPDDIGLPAAINTATALSGFTSLFPLADGDYTLTGQSIAQANQFKYYHLAPTTTGTFMLRTTGEPTHNWGYIRATELSC